MLLSMTDKVGLTDIVRNLVEKLLEGSPVFLVDFSVRGSKGSHAVDIFVESDETLDVNQLAELSRRIGFTLDIEDALPGRYTLNVSSPGADRPLRLLRQYHKHLGRNLRVHYRKEEDVSTEIQGELLAVHDSSIEIQNGGGAVEIQHEDIHWAKVRLPW